MEKVDEPSKIKKRVYHIMVEGLQNITKHQDTQFTNTDKSGFFIIQKKGNTFVITTANLIHDAKKESLSTHIEEINKLNKEEIRKYYKQVLSNGELSEKGGAGLGLIDMARKSGAKLLYEFKKYDSEYSFFYLHTQIQAVANADSNLESRNGSSLKHVINLHGLLSKINVLLIINSLFEQDSIVSLLSIIERQMVEVLSAKKKVYNIMVEMLQNIIHHGSNNKDIEGKPGIFFISEKTGLNEEGVPKGEYLLNTGNYILNNSVRNLKDKIEYLNRLNLAELNEFYNKRLLNFEIDNSRETGLGLIDIRLKSQNKIVFDFHRVDNNYSFFTLRICVLKN